jgi:hypothetical protein
MILSLAQEPKLVISPEAMVEAIAESERLLGNVRKTTIGKQGMSETATLKTIIIMELLNRENHQISRKMLMRKLWSHYGNSEEFDNLMQSFDATGLIITSSVGNQIIYTMPENQVEELKRYMAGKQQKER